MTKIIESIEMCEKNRERQTKEVERLSLLLGRAPRFVIINASDDAGNARYVEGKNVEGAKTGLEMIIKKFEEDCTEKEILSLIHWCNTEKIPVIVQSPVYKHLDEKKLMNAIDYKVDADCFSKEWLGRLANNTNGTLGSATPKGVINILEYYDVNVEGKMALVVGRSNHVGKPMGTMLINKGATTIVANSKTSNLDELVRQSDIIVSCVGKMDLIKAKDIKKDAVVIGVGFTYVGRKQILDFSVEDVVADGKASLVSNRINCTGKATIDALIDNVIELYKMNTEI
mgnify:CR=1 FL=1